MAVTGIVGRRLPGASAQAGSTDGEAQGGRQPNYPRGAVHCDHRITNM